MLQEYENSNYGENKNGSNSRRLMSPETNKSKRSSSEELVVKHLRRKGTSPYEGFGSKAFLPDSVSELFDLEVTEGLAFKTKSSNPPVEIMELKTSWIGANEGLYDSRNPQTYNKSEVTDFLQKSNLHHSTLSTSKLDKELSKK
jgi:hypothetical protein